MCVVKQFCFISGFFSFHDISSLLISRKIRLYTKLFILYLSLTEKKKKKKPKKKQPCKINIAGVYVMHRLECTDYACWYIVMMYW